eukprot:EG_transcript_1843
MKDDLVRISLISEHKFIKQNKVISVPSDIMFCSLMEKIKECTSLRDEGFSILWQDEDEDRIDIAGDEDWSSALLYQRGYDQPKHFVFILKEDPISPSSATSEDLPCEVKSDPLQRCTHWLDTCDRSKLQHSPPASPHHSAATRIPVPRQCSVDLPQIPKSPINQFARPRSVSNVCSTQLAGANLPPRKPFLPWLPSSPGSQSIRAPDGRRQLIPGKGSQKGPHADLVACLQRSGVPLWNSGTRGLAKPPDNGGLAVAVPAADASNGRPPESPSSKWQRVDSPNGRRHFVLDKVEKTLSPTASATPPRVARKLPLAESAAKELSTEHPTRPSSSGSDSTSVAPGPLPTPCQDQSGSVGTAARCGTADGPPTGPAPVAHAPRIRAGDCRTSPEPSASPPGRPAPAPVAPGDWRGTPLSDAPATQRRGDGTPASRTSPPSPSSLAGVSGQPDSPRHAFLCPPTPPAPDIRQPVSPSGLTPSTTPRHFKGTPASPVFAPRAGPCPLPPVPRWAGSPGRPPPAPVDGSPPERSPGPRPGAAGRLGRWRRMLRLRQLAEQQEGLALAGADTDPAEGPEWGCPPRGPAPPVTPQGRPPSLAAVRPRGKGGKRESAVVAETVSTRDELPPLSGLPPASGRLWASLASRSPLLWAGFCGSSFCLTWLWGPWPSWSDGAPRPAPPPPPRPVVNPHRVTDPPVHPERLAPRPPGERPR